MLIKSALVALAASSLVEAHGKVASITGDAGGNGTALAIQGGVVPGPGRNKVTEVDTTVFQDTNIMTDGLGKTPGSGQNKVAMASQAMALSGNTLPQVSAQGGTLSGTFHVVTTDGAGPLEAVVDPTGTGTFSQGVKLKTTTQVPGNNGNIRPNGKVPRDTILSRTLDSVRRSLGIQKRASNVNQDFPMAFEVPAGTTCTGTMNGMQNVCLAKIANSNKAGPFGGVVPFQMANGAPVAVPAASAAAAATSSAAPTSSSAPTTKNSKSNGTQKRRAVSFDA